MVLMRWRRGLRADAVKAINTALARSDRIILTSRMGEYRAVIEQGDVLRAAAVVEIEDLSVDDVTDYLRKAAKKQKQGERIVTKWDYVLRLLDEGYSADS